MLQPRLGAMPADGSSSTRRRRRGAARRIDALEPLPLLMSLLASALPLLLLLARPTAGVKLQGGSAVALAGKNCAVLAMDQRVGTRCGIGRLV